MQVTHTPALLRSLGIAAVLGVLAIVASVLFLHLTAAIRAQRPKSD